MNYGQSLSSTSWNQNQVTQLFLTLTRGGKARKNLAISSGLILQKEMMVRKLIFNLCLPQYITIDLNQNSPPKKEYYADKTLSKKARSNLELPPPPHVTGRRGTMSRGEGGGGGCRKDTIFPLFHKFISRSGKYV